MKNLKSFFVLVKESEVHGENDRIKNYDELILFFTELEIYVFDEQLQMKKFLEQFAEGLDPYQWAEYLYDYYHNPEEYSIEEDSEYYDQICEFYENSVQPHELRRYYSRFDENSIAKTPEYKLYREMSSKNR